MSVSPVNKLHRHLRQLSPSCWIHPTLFRAFFWDFLLLLSLQQHRVSLTATPNSISARASSEHKCCPSVSMQACQCRSTCEHCQSPRLMTVDLPTNVSSRLAVRRHHSLFAHLTSTLLSCFFWVSTKLKLTLQTHITKKIILFILPSSHEQLLETKSGFVHMYLFSLASMVLSELQGRNVYFLSRPVLKLYWSTS